MDSPSEFCPAVRDLASTVLEKCDVPASPFQKEDLDQILVRSKSKLVDLLHSEVTDKQNLSLYLDVPGESFRNQWKNPAECLNGTAEMAAARHEGIGTSAIMQYSVYETQVREIESRYNARSLSRRRCKDVVPVRVVSAPLSPA